MNLDVVLFGPVAVRAKLDRNIPPAGTSFVQFSVAEPTEGLEWTQP